MYNTKIERVNMKCIICRQDKDEFSDEHLIPESIGGCYHIFTVCKQCNSKLGNNVDNKLVNHYFADMMRYELGIEGKTGFIPNPFSGTHVLIDDESTKVRTTLKADGNIDTYLIPRIHKKDIPNGTEIKIQLDSSDENKIKEIITNILKRQKGKYDIDKVLEKLEFQSESFMPNIKMEKIIDAKEFKIGLLKIAYEFAVDSISDYFEDEKAIEISKFLYKVCKEKTIDLERIDNYFIGDGIASKEMMKIFDIILDLNKKRHVLVLKDYPGIGLVCIISLYNLFTIGVKLSNKSYINNNFLFLFNNLDSKDCEKLDMFELFPKIAGPKKIDFLYNLKNQFEYEKFCEKEKVNDDNVFTMNNETVFFDRNYNIKYKSLNELILKNINNVESDTDGTTYINQLDLKEELYVKFLPDDFFVQVISIRSSQKVIGKY